MSRDAPRRKTVKRFDVPHGVHGLTFSCLRRRPFLASDLTRQYFCDAVNSSRAKHGFHVWAYVIMPEHVHLVVWFPQERYSISAALQSIKQSVGRRATDYLRANNPRGLDALRTGLTDRPYSFWLDGGGHDDNIDDERKLGNWIEYVHNNPVKRGLCLYAEDWVWSSAADWGGVRSGPVALDKDSLGE